MVSIAKKSVMKYQLGGTFLGFVVGVVFGLAAALAVAVYVTKVPIPFVTKMQSRTADQDAAEAKKNKDWDPNAPLYGKTPVKPMGTASAASGGAVTSSPGEPAPGLTPNRLRRPIHWAILREPGLLVALLSRLPISSRSVLSRRWKTPRPNGPRYH